MTVSFYKTSTTLSFHEMSEEQMRLGGTKTVMGMPQIGLIDLEINLKLGWESLITGCDGPKNG